MFKCLAFILLILGLSSSGFAQDPVLVADATDLIFGSPHANLNFTATRAGDVTAHSLLLSFTAVQTDDHALELIVDAAGFGDVRGIEIEYDTGTLLAGSQEAAILVSFNETDATGGDLFGLEVLSTEGGADLISAVGVGAGIGIAHQSSGTFENPVLWNNDGVDETSEVAGSGTSSVFVADDDFVIVTLGSKFSEIEIVMTTVSSGGGIRPTFEYSDGTGGGTGFSAFAPTDATDGFRFTGEIEWLISNIPLWVTNTSGNFEIRITRTRNVLTTTPIVDTVQVVQATIFEWDKSGNLNINKLGIDVASPNNKIQVAGLINFDDTNFNVFLGTDAFSNTAGDHNVGIGFEAGKNNDDSGGGVTGNENVYIGYQAGKGDAGGNSGDTNVGIGRDVLLANTTGRKNMAIGARTLTLNTTGFQNVAVGQGALNANITGSNNIAIGNGALAVSNALQNVAIGTGALVSLTSGDKNTVIGDLAGKENQTGSFNTTIGYFSGGAGASNDSHSNSTVVGAFSGRRIETGSNNVFIGYNSGTRQTTNSNLLIIDNQDRSSAAGELTDAMIYGVFNATPASQTITFNANILAGTGDIGTATGNLEINPSVAGAAVLTFGHASDGDTFVFEGDITAAGNIDIGSSTFDTTGAVSTGNLSVVGTAVILTGSGAALTIRESDDGFDAVLINPSTTTASFSILNGGAQSIFLSTNSETVFNDLGVAIDFRIEGDTNANLFVVDGSADTVGIGIASAATLLHLFSAAPDIQYDDTVGDDWIVGNNGGDFRFRNETDARTDFTIDGAGLVIVAADLSVNGGDINTASGNLELNPSTAGAAALLLGNLANGDTIEVNGIMDWKVTMSNSTADPTTEAPADWIQVKIGTTQGWVPVYHEPAERPRPEPQPDPLLVSLILQIEQMQAQIQALQNQIERRQN